MRIYWLLVGSETHLISDRYQKILMASMFYLPILHDWLLRDRRQFPCRSVNLYNLI